MNNGIIVLASNNQGKLNELQQILSPLGHRLQPQANYTTTEVQETGLTFVENALLKARHAAAVSHLPAIADDSGLVVPALDGAPGIFSARYSGEGATDARNLDCLLNKMATITDRRAYFYCVMVYLTHANDPTPLIATGILEGELLYEKKGSHGFGYDPIFYLPELGKTTAEITMSEKNKISHRAKATKQLIEQLTVITA